MAGPAFRFLFRPIKPRLQTDRGGYSRCDETGILMKHRMSCVVCERWTIRYDTSLCAPMHSKCAGACHGSITEVPQDGDD